MDIYCTYVAQLAQCTLLLIDVVINRPGVAKAVQQTPILLIMSVSHISFVEIYPKHCLSQMVRAS